LAYPFVKYPFYPSEIAEWQKRFSKQITGIQLL